MGKQKKLGLGVSLKSNIKNQKFNASDRHTVRADTKDYETLSSCTQENSLESFLRTADLANIDFTAERLNAKVITQQYSEAIPHPDVLAERKSAFVKHQDDVTIPRRPPWTKETTKEQLDRNEKDAFLEWRKSMAIVQENQHIILTPFEKNLEVWRQLWRVVERSNVVIQIVDARNPMFYRSSDLERYVKEVSQDKDNMILINKSDMLSDLQRKCWFEYFKSNGLDPIFYSAIEELEKITEEQEGRVGIETKHQLDVEKTDEDMCEDGQEEIIDNYNKFNVLSVHVEDPDEISGPDGSKVDVELIADDINTAVLEDKPQWAMTDPISQPEDHMANGDHIPASEDQMILTQTEENSDGDTVMKSEIDEIKEKIKLGEVLHNSELLTYLTMLLDDEKFTIGFVGYPNVGKSSTLNSLLQEKRVQVSSTPGKTKHFQTFELHISGKHITLCDCPGLVFPNLANSKSEMICHGVLPIDHMRDHVGPMTYLIATIPRIVLESLYGLTLPRPDELENNRLPYPYEVLREYGSLRGFMTTRGTPDESRAARIMLKDYVNGKLLFVKPPPNYENTEEDFNPICDKYMQRAEKIATHIKKTAITVTKENVENNFFKKPEPKLMVQGRAPATVGPGNTAELAAGKPWKKHFKGNRKEKTRRKTQDLNY